MINVAFLTIMLIYMEKVGYKDYESASFVSFRFLGVLLFAFPLGLFIKGRKLKPIFKISSIASPILALVIIEAIHLQYDVLLYTSLFLLASKLLLYPTYYATQNQKHTWKPSR